MIQKIIKFFLGIPLIFIVSLILQHCVFLEYFWFTHKELLEFQCSRYTYEEVVLVVCILWLFWIVWEIWNDSRWGIENGEFQSEKTIKSGLVSGWGRTLVVLLKILWSFIFLLLGFVGIWLSLIAFFSMSLWGVDDVFIWMVLIGWPILSILWTKWSIKIFLLWKKGDTKNIKNLKEVQGLSQKQPINHSPTLQKIIENAQKNENN